MADEDNKPGDGDNVGSLMAAKLLENLVVSNQNSEKLQKVLRKVDDGLDELVGYFECFSNTMGILDDIKQNKKTKLTLDDFVSAWASAEEETFPDEDEDESGDEDPKVPNEPQPIGSGPTRRI